MSKLFVSHASEDKDAIARDLAIELKKNHDVWFDEFTLKAGDSLRASIDAGLHQCDFGVVILSPAFFAKKWTNAELNGLFALEEQNRRLIIPVWFNVGFEEVSKYSPMLADRVAVRAANGIEAAVHEINIAVAAAQRSHDVVAPDPGKRALKSAMAVLNARTLDEKILRSEIGANMFALAQNRIENSVWRVLSELNVEGRQLFSRPKAMHFLVNGPCRVTLSIFSRKVYSNSVRDATLLAVVHREPTGFDDDETRRELESVTWRPTCVEEMKLGFKQEDTDLPENEEKVSDSFVALIAKFIEEFAREKE
jgi:hypothetical protein